MASEGPLLLNVYFNIPTCTLCHSHMLGYIVVSGVTASPCTPRVTAVTIEDLPIGSTWLNTAASEPEMMPDTTCKTQASHLCTYMDTAQLQLAQPTSRL